jgi:hypothetical protein
MVEQLEDIKGYSKLSEVDKVKYAAALKAYLDDIKKDALENMDILEVRKSAFKIPVYYTIFMFGNLKRTVTIKFKKGMLIGGK